MTVSIRHGNLGAVGTEISGSVRAPASDGEPIQPAVWSLTEGGEKGSTTMAGFVIEDPAGTITPIGQKEVHFEDDACTEPTIFAGFFDSRDIQRAPALRTGAEREWDAQVTDLNVLLGDYTILAGSRPAETDIARIDWLLASGYLPIGDAGFIDRSSPVSLPKTDYTGRNAADVLAECSNKSNKNYFVRWEQAATFPDPASPWAPALVSLYVPPGAGPGFVPSSLDALGGKFGGAAGGTYYPGAGYASTHALGVAGCVNYGSQQPIANNGSQFGFGTAGPYVAYPCDMTAEGRWVWDLTAAGLPTIATVGLYEWVRGAIGYPAQADWSVEVSDNGTTWTTLFDQTAITAAPVTLGASILPVTGGSAHRYLSLHITVTVPGGGDWVGNALGLLLWAGTAIGPGPALGYHETNWSGDTSGLAISNVLAEFDGVTTFLPSESDKLTRNPGRVYSGCWFDYSGGHVYVPNATTLAGFRHRDVSASDMTCTKAAQATVLATAYLVRCETEEDRITVNLENVPAASVNLARPGQRIPVKFSHVPGYESGAYLAIMQRTVAPAAAGAYNLALDCAEPKLTGYFAARNLKPALWQNVGVVVSPAPSDVTQAVLGQRVALTYIRDGDGVAALVTLGSAYMPGSVLIEVDALPVSAASITETDPDVGTITLDFAPLGASGSYPAQAIAASWQVA